MKKKKTIVLAIVVLLAAGLVYFFLTASESFKYSVTHFCRQYDQRLEMPRELKDANLILSADLLESRQSFYILKKQNSDCSFYDQEILGNVLQSPRGNQEALGEYKIEEVIHTKCLSWLLCIGLNDTWLRFLIRDQNNNKYMLRASYLYGQPVRKPIQYYSYIKVGEEVKLFEIDKYFPQYIDIR